MLQKLKKEQEGFTIIEVLIVLAIAGLILLIVFLAVPALQRNTRNNGRKNDASRIGTAINDYVSNANGALPVVSGAGANWTGAGNACNQIITDAGSLSQGTWAVGNCTANTQGASDFDADNSGTFTTPTAQTTGFELILVEGTGSGATAGATCNGTTISYTSNTRQAALLYDLETGSGSYNWSCITVQ